MTSHHNENEPGLFTIGEAVAELQRDYPDMSHSSLRFLQREGLVQPVRTAGGHRKFSESDLARIHLIKQWQAHRLSLAEIRRRLEGLDTHAAPAQLVQLFLEQATQGNGPAATQLVLQADDLGMPLGRMFDEVLRPALHDVGRQWATGELSVAQEHEIAELSRDLIAELTLRHARIVPRQPRVIAACVADELHDLGLRMVCGFLRHRGVGVHYLGANVSPQFLVESVRLRRPELVLLSISREASLPALCDTVAALRAAPPESAPPKIVVGGQGCVGHEGSLGDDVLVLADERLEIVADRILAAWQPT
jgi:DNA-binding transcriptional MerR regulator